MENVLKNIVSKKKERIKIYKREYSENKLFEDIKNINNFIDFKNKIKKRNSEQKISIIAEIKKASPSTGIIVQDYNPVDIAKKYYEIKSTCLSVLTEEEFFLGSLDHIYKIKSKMIPMEPSGMLLPILCKDFFIDPYQVHLAKYYGADAILIILSAVTEKIANQLYEEALKLDMSVIVEVHTKDEAKYSLKFSDALIGINNRNLKTLETNVNATYDIHNILINHSGPLISESGIKTKEELLEITKKTKIKTFLIGESLLKNLDKNSIFSVL